MGKCSCLPVLEGPGKRVVGGMALKRSYLMVKKGSDRHKLVGNWQVMSSLSIKIGAQLARKANLYS